MQFMSFQQFTAKPFYNQLLGLIQRICIDNHVDDTHGYAHAVKIGLQTQQALKSQLGVTVDSSDYESIILAGYLHDMDDRKYFKTHGYSNAVKVLTELKIPQKSIDKIVKMIDLVSFSKNGNTIDHQYHILYYLPRYIDRVEAIGMQGLYRSYAYNQQRMSSTPVILESTPKPRSVEQAFLMGKGREVQYMKAGFSKSVVDHFFDKLIHIRLPPEITNQFLINLYETKLYEMINFIIENAKDNYANYEKNLLKWHESKGSNTSQQ